jgi:iron complex outermembrane recepter protein
MRYLQPMRLSIIILGALLLLTTSAVSQHQQGEHSAASQQGEGEKVDASQATIIGLAQDESGNAIPFASISIFNVNDSTFVKGAATDLDGNYAISIRPGKYYLTVSFLSYEEQVISNVEIVKGQLLAIEPLVLKENTTLLEEFEVIGEHSQMELKLDKRVFNVGKDLANNGGSASEVLDNVPSVAVDVEGNVSLRGSEGVRILIDGQPSGLLGASTADALKLIPANVIERVEVITNPSARYDAEGEVGIINIVLKKEKKKGLNGMFEITAGYPSNYGASYSINYRKKWINLFSSYGINYRKNPGSGYSYQSFDLGDTTYAYERVRDHSRGGLSNNFKLGSDFYVGKTHVITVAGLYRYSLNLNDATIIYNDYDATGATILSTERVDDEQEIRKNMEGSLRYKRTFNKKGREWVTNLKYIQSDDAELSDLVQTTNETLYLPLLQRSSNIEDERNSLFQSDYVHPFGEQVKFEGGVKGSWRTINNDYEVELQDDLGDWFILAGYNNNMIYTENIYAAYGMLGKEWTKFSSQLGLRYEYSDISTELIETNETNKRSYSNFFPSAHFSYKVDSTNTAQFSYSRRLTRPRFRHLLPFYGYTDNRNFYSGNPNLNPEYTNSFDLGYLKQLKKGSILASIYYRYRTGVIQRITLMDDNGYINTFPINLTEEHAYGLELNGSYELAKKWRVNGSFNFYRATNSGSYDGVDYGSDTYAWTTKLTSKITLPKKINWQLSFDYRSPKNSIQGKRLAMYSLNTGFSKDVLKNKGTISIAGKDLLNSRKHRSETYGANFYTVSEFQWQTRQIIFSFNYRLNKKNQQGGSRGEHGGNY